MKKLTLFIIVVLTASITACKKKKDDPHYEGPKVSDIVINGKSYAINSNVTFKAGDTLNWSVTLTDDRALASVEISQAHSGVSSGACGYDTIFYSTGLSGTSQTINFTYKVPLFMDMDQKNCITFYMKDNDDDEEGPKFVAQLLTILVKPESKPYNFTYPNARVYNYQSTNGIQCWNMFTNAAVDENTPNYHFRNDTYVGDLSTPPGYKSAVYFYGGTTKKAPAGFNYAAANDSLCDAIFNSLPSFAANQNATVGEIFIARTNYRKYTVFKITNIVTTTGDDNDYTEFEYKRYSLSYYQ